MYKLITEISKRCHASATKRGKDTSCVGCIKYLRDELAEYWAAYDAGRTCENLRDIIVQAATLHYDKFVEFYDDHIHNTTVDELADILITAASYYEAVRLSLADEGEDQQPQGRTIDELILNGAVRFVCSRVLSPVDVNMLHWIVLCKMHYNDLRED